MHYFLNKSIVEIGKGIKSIFGCDIKCAVNAHADTQIHTVLMLYGIPVNIAAAAQFTVEGLFLYFLCLFNVIKSCSGVYWSNCCNESRSQVDCSPAEQLELQT